MKKLKRYMLFNSETSFELGEVQISLHKIMHVDWFRFCALRHDDEAREMLAEIADNCVSEEERHQVNDWNIETVQLQKMLFRLF